MPRWNGISMIPPTATSHVLTSDALGRGGCGTGFQNLWIQLPWPQHWEYVAITPKEFAPHRACSGYLGAGAGEKFAPSVTT